MTFSELLNEAMERAGCSAKDLAGASGLSSAILSRWRSGERAPRTGSASLRQLAAGIAAVSAENGRAAEEAELLEAFERSLGGSGLSFERIAANLNALIERLELPPTEMARRLNYDPSYFYRIRAGERRPADLNAFSDKVCHFVLRRFPDAEKRAGLAALLGCGTEAVADNGDCYLRLKQWLSDENPEAANPIGDFLAKLDLFDLNEYIRSIHFDTLRIPTVPFQIPVSRTYYGVEQMKAGELDFLKATVSSRSAEPVFMCSDMPMADMARDLDFCKKWMFGLAAVMKKGLRLSIIHNIDRPFAEMMLGLESWIPLYMTGQVSPYYFSAPQNAVYCHFINVSGAAALSGECVAGQHAHGKYHLTKNREELRYSRRRAEDLLKKARPLMEIYQADARERLEAFLASDAEERGARHDILSAPPIFTISDELLREILDRNQIAPALRAEIADFAARQRRRMERILAENEVLDEVALRSETEFSRHPASLPLAAGFLETDIPYTYEEYARHLEQTKAYAGRMDNYTVELTARHAFRNIQISIHEGKWAMVSKGNAPVVHFVIRHPKLRSAIENMVIPVEE